MSGMFASTRSAWERMSPRERMLIGVLGALILAAAAWYLVAVPGWTAARSASNRLQAAQAELAEVRALAAELAVQQDIARKMDPASAQETARTLAPTHGLTVVSMSEADGSVQAALSGPSSVQALAWADAVSRRTAMRLAAFSVSPSGPGELVVTVRFARGLE